MPRISRFKRRNSDRSGFKFYEIELIKDGPWKVAGDEFDTPPPSRIPLGGEGDIATGEPLAFSNFQLGVGATSASFANSNPTVFLTAAGGITPTFTHPWMYISGSNTNVTIATTPQIAAGKQSQVLTLQCVGSTVTLSQGSGVNFMDSRGSLTMISGRVVTFVYQTGGSVWWEASRNQL